MTYSDKLRNAKWQRKRYEVLERDNWTCRGCRATNVELHVHHIVYYSGREPWEYDNIDLITYCKLCHNWEHGIIPIKDRSDEQISWDGINTRNKVPSLDEIRDFIINKKNE